MKKNSRILLKFVLLGDGYVGKTAIRKRYMDANFTEDYFMSLGADLSTKRIDNIVIQIWDLAGQPGFSSVRQEYYLGTHGVILTFSLIDRSTFINLSNWIQEIHNNLGEMIPISIIGNKSDLIGLEKDVVTQEEIEHYLKELENKYKKKFWYIITSAKLNKNIKPIFDCMIERILSE